MSNHLAIASVTASLAKLLRQGIGVDVGDTNAANDVVAGADVTAERPDATANATTKPRINIYLYQVTPNAAWRNSDLPTRDSDGQLKQRPRAAIDLHYLLTFYGDEKQFEPQRLLGAAIRTLHSQPILGRQLIRNATSAFGFLAASNLAEDIELVRFTPTTLTLEELSRLWAVFFQTQYTLSVTYQASVVLIETDDTPSSTLPVLERNVYVVPFRTPVVEKVKLDAAADGPIIAGGNVVITGRALRGDVTKVNFGGSQLLPPLATSATETEVKVTLPADLRAGIQGLQVEQKFMMGTPPDEHSGFESNVAPFVLIPVITQPTPPAFTQTIDPVTQVVSKKITVNFTPKVGKTQRVRLVLNEFHPLPAPSSRSYVINAPKDNGVASNQQETDKIEFELKDVVAGDYLVRVQVDGAENQLDRDLNAGSPTFNKFIGPKVTVA